MERREDWPEVLVREVANARTRAFAWGEFDCIAWAGAVVAAMTGVNPFADIAGAYATEAEAVVLRDARGGLKAYLDERLPEPVLVSFAQRGDVVLYEHPGLLPAGWPQGVGICLGDHLVAPSTRGLQSVAVARAIAAWRV